MEIHELAVVAAVVGASGYAAYVLGRRRHDPTPPAERATEASPSMPPEPPPPKTAPPKAETSEEAPKADAGVEPAKATPTAEAAASVPTLAYEEDTDVDPTRVGITAGVSMDVPVLRVVHDADADVDEPTRVDNVFLLYATAQTDPGLRRKRNEDSLLTRADDGLFVVADGMGGHRGGAFASTLAVETIGRAYRDRSFIGNPHAELPAAASELARALHMANTAIFQAAKAKELAGMGTTICAALFSPKKERLYIAHVGDSRLYRLRDGVLTQITSDHTMSVFGVTGPESAHLSRAVGIWPAVPIDIVFAVPLPNDVYLLCSDGLTKMLSDETIGTVLRAEEEPEKAVERLIFFANAHGGKDNITVILIRLAPTASQRPKS